MAVPVRHNEKWRIRWFDENGKRQSEVYDERPAALRAPGDEKVEKGFVLGEVVEVLDRVLSAACHRGSFIEREVLPRPDAHVEDTSRGPREFHRKGTA